ncbi:calcium-binding protein [Calothrix sp. FACHB-156]|nr:calcium-binding protein [Calothrix sp. FACHB-156]
MLGGKGDDTLSGGSGNDALEGGDGNDRLYGDVGNDVLLGGDGDDWLVGGEGRDFLTGGSNSDRFYLTGTGEFDTIIDFNPGVDKIVISKLEFSLSQAPGTLDAGLFRTGTRATTESDRFIYDRIRGNLFFDADGTGSTGQIQIGQLFNRAALTSNDITVIA